jgi:5-oxoprolinase (ATP-hydrolysing)
MGVPDALVIFGSAGGQHCCDLALKIGVNKIFIHKYSGVLSAYGLS